MSTKRSVYSPPSPPRTAKYTAAKGMLDERHAGVRGFLLPQSAAPHLAKRNQDLLLSTLRAAAATVSQEEEEHKYLRPGQTAIYLEGPERDPDRPFAVIDRRSARGMGMELAMSIGAGLEHIQKLAEDVAESHHYGLKEVEQEKPDPNLAWHRWVERYEHSLLKKTTYGAQQTTR